jgi:TetR/AcrR family transcriptional regulator, tetracycline repressor protein
VALDRDQVVKTAIDLLDEVGLDGLSLRRLARELGVQAPALYWHFPSKQALLDQMSETIATTEAPARRPEPDETWEQWLADRARTMRRALNRHRDGAMLAASTRPQPSQWNSIEDELSVLTEAGLTPAQSLHTMIAMGNYVSGFTLDEQGDRMRGPDNRPDDPAEFETALNRLTGYPTLVAALREVGDPQGDRAFEAGLALIITGVRDTIRAGRDTD